MINRKGLEFSFAWMFAIIVGAFIILLAIYAATKLVSTQNAATQAEVGKQMGILLNPVETGIESAKISIITFPSETRVYDGCNDNGAFGSQKISVAGKAGIGNSWLQPGVPSTFYNRYLFAENMSQDKEFILFSKPFSMPYKIADIIFMWPKNQKYCFVSPPRTIEDEITSLNPDGINITNNVRDCAAGSKTVCFSSSGCDMDVRYGADENVGTVTKDYETVYYQGALIYGAIFAPRDIYECQVKRLMKRASELAILYATKSGSSSSGCDSLSLIPELEAYANASQIDNSFGLEGAASIADDIGRANDNLQCKLF